MKWTPLTASDLTHFRRVLLKRLSELIGDLRDVEQELEGIREAHGVARTARDSGDASVASEREDLLHAIDSHERREVLEILHALDRIETGRYGICERTGRFITKMRLETVPWARYSVEAAREAEDQAGRASGRIT